MGPLDLRFDCSGATVEVLLGRVKSRVAGDRYSISTRPISTSTAPAICAR